MKLLIRNIELSPHTDPAAVPEQIIGKVSPVIPRSHILSAALSRKSVDARRRDNVKVIVSAVVTTDCDVSEEKRRKLGAEMIESHELSENVSAGEERLSDRPVIVGLGPCGMFCALRLAQLGYRPVVIERGGSISERRAAVSRFYAGQGLDTGSNIQFGAGGAGTFSDGKLLTRIHDPKCGYVIDTFHRFGAPDSILTDAKPHIGTDILYRIVENICAEIGRLGGTVLYHTRLDNVRKSGGKVTGIVTNNGEIPCGALILCTGHSARDTFAMLGQNGFPMIPKPFSVGVRIEHLQCEIDEAMYGRFAGLPLLGHAEYQLSHRLDDGTGVYTFCMCPGGEVVAAASEEGQVVVNGMSNSARSGRNANSAVAVSVSTEAAEAFGGGIAFQRMLEKAAYEAGKGGKLPYSAPCQRLGEFLNGEKTASAPTKVLPTYMNGNVVMTDVGSLFPAYFASALRTGITAMDKKLGRAGVFASSDALVTGVETRTSSPLRILRGEDMTAIGFDNVYPCGEGAGYAGGITSAAVDGLSCADAVIAKYKPFE